MLGRLRKGISSKQNLIFAIGLICLFYFALWLRMNALDWGLPFRLHPDEWKYVSAGAECHRGDWNPKYFRNPPGFSYLNALWYPFWLNIRQPVSVPEWTGIDEKWLKPTTHVEATYLYRPFDLVLGGRVLSALSGAFTCVAVFFLAREFFPVGYALGTAWLMAVSFANVRECHFAVNDPSATCLVTWAMFMGIRGYRCGKRRWWYSAAALSGIALAFKYNMAPGVLALIGLRGLRFWENPNETTRKRLGVDILILVTLAGICFLSICPFPITDPETFFQEMAKLREASVKPWQGQDPRWSGIQLMETIWISEGVCTTIFALLGLGFSLRKRQWAMVLFPLFYVLLILSHRLFYVRFSLPMLPWISIWGTAILQAGMERFSLKKAWLIGGALFFFGLAAWEPLSKDFRSNFLFKQEDTRIEFLRWLKTKETSSALVAVDQFAVPLLYRNVASIWTEPIDPRIIYIDRLPSEEFHQLHRLPQPVGIIAMSSFVTLPGYLPFTYEQRRKSLQDFSNGDKAWMQFQPFQSIPTHEVGDAEDTYSPFRQLRERQQPGASIEIYRLDSKM